ncbi:MAG TPA: hypothetical protein VJ843_05665 [Candidatus Saccharimonadales bacterium]|nr:hypothetical protein [Candidatus Saccharimonadales bacterium]
MTHEFSQPAHEQLPPMPPGEAWADAVQTPGTEESYLTRGELTVLHTDTPIELPKAFDKIPPTLAKEPLALIYAGNPRAKDKDGTVGPQKSWEFGTVFVVYGKSLSTEKTDPNNDDNAIRKVGMRDIPRVYQIDITRGTTSHVGEVRQNLSVGRDTLPAESTPKQDMSRSHFTLACTPDGNLSLVDHSSNGTAVLKAEELDQTKEYSTAHDLGQTIVTSQIQQ